MEQIQPGEEVALITQPRKKLWVYSFTTFKTHVRYLIWDGCNEYYDVDSWQIAKYVPVTE